jgi:hypothetical protein
MSLTDVIPQLTDQKRDGRGLRYLELRFSTGLKHRCEKLESAIIRETGRELTADHKARLGVPGYLTLDQFLTKLADSTVNDFIVRKVVNTALNEDRPCDARCTSAHGPSCDCSCRGRQHGRDTPA